MLEWLKSKSIKSFATGIAKTQLQTLRIIQNQHPELTGDLLYEQVIAQRPSYNIEKAKQVIREARESFERTSWMKKDKQFGFCQVVSALILDEYSKDKILSREDVNALLIIELVVKDIIPENL